MSVPPTSTVLLVEDNPNDVLFLRRAWQKAQLPYPLQVVKDGDAAIAYLTGVAPFADRAQYPLPVLMLLDLKLPRRSGLEVLEWLRQQPTLRRLPVVILTSSHEPGDIHNAYDRFANSYLTKPTTPAALQDLVAVIHRYWLTINEAPL